MNNDHLLFYVYYKYFLTLLSMSSRIDTGIICFPRVYRSLIRPCTVTLSMPFYLIISQYFIMLPLQWAFRSSFQPEFINFFLKYSYNLYD